MQAPAAQEQIIAGGQSSSFDTQSGRVGQIGGPQLPSASELSHTPHADQALAAPAATHPSGLLVRTAECSVTGVLDGAQDLVRERSSACQDQNSALVAGFIPTEHEAAAGCSATTRTSTCAFCCVQIEQHLMRVSLAPACMCAVDESPTCAWRPK